MMYDCLNEPCNRCQGTDVVSDTAAGDIVCRSCGEIQASRVIDTSAEWREFSEDDRGTNGSAARSSCTVDKYGSTSTEFAGGVSEAVRNALAKTQMLATDKRELKTRKAVEFIGNIGSTLHLTRKILDCAYHLCSRAIMENSSQAKTIELLAAAVISLACRLEGYPRTLQEISQATRLDVCTISRVQTILARDLQIVTGIVAPQDLIARIVCNPLVRMTDPVAIQYAKDTCRNASEEGILDGQQPQASAAASVIFISTVRSYFEKKNLNSISGKKNSTNSADEFKVEKGDINILLTVDMALTTITCVKKAYTTLLLNANIVVPQGLKNKILQIIPEKEELYWSTGMPTFDNLLKIQKSKSTKYELGVEKEKIENQKMKDRIEKRGQSGKEVKMLPTSRIEEIKKEQNTCPNNARISPALPFSPSSSQRAIPPVTAAISTTIAAATATVKIEAAATVKIEAVAAAMTDSTAIPITPELPATVKIEPVQNPKSVYSVIESNAIRTYVPLNISDNGGRNEQNVLHPKTVDRAGYTEQNYGTSLKTIYTENDFVLKNEKIKFIEAVPDMNMNLNRNLAGINCENSGRKMQKIVK